MMAAQACPEAISPCTETECEKESKNGREALHRAII